MANKDAQARNSFMGLEDGMVNTGSSKQQAVGRMCSRSSIGKDEVLCLLLTVLFIIQHPVSILLFIRIEHPGSVFISAIGNR
jgi:hypothetical protein